MRIWIDLGNSPHVPFFARWQRNSSGAGIPFCGRHATTHRRSNSRKRWELTQKFSAHTAVKAFFGKEKNLSLAFGIYFDGREEKTLILLFRIIRKNRSWSRGFSQIKGVTLMDYEHHPGNRLSFRAATKVIVPENFSRRISTQIRSVQNEGIISRHQGRRLFIGFRAG